MLDDIYSPDDFCGTVKLFIRLDRKKNNTAINQSVSHIILDFLN